MDLDYLYAKLDYLYAKRRVEWSGGAETGWASRRKRFLGKLQRRRRRTASKRSFFVHSTVFESFLVGPASNKF